MVTDPIADFLTHIRNSYMAGRQTVEISHSNVKENLAQLLKKEGYIQDVKIKDQRSKHDKADLKILEIELKYTDNKPAIETIKRVSTPGRKFYVNKKEIPSVLSGYGTAVISTSNGLITGTEARRQHVGGEVICYIS